MGERKRERERERERVHTYIKYDLTVKRQCNTGQNKAQKLYEDSGMGEIERLQAREKKWIKSNFQMLNLTVIFVNINISKKNYILLCLLNISGGLKLGIESILNNTTNTNRLCNLFQLPIYNKV